MTFFDKFIKSLIPISIFIFFGSIFFIESLRSENIGLFSIGLIMMFTGIVVQILYFYKK